MIEIIDSNGCAIDKFLLTNLNYSVSTNGNLEAGQFSSVYKYADEESMYFQCQIKIWRRKALTGYLVLNLTIKINSKKKFLF